MPDICLQLRPSGKLKDYMKMFDFAERCGFDGVEIIRPPLDMDYERLHLLSLEHNMPIKSIISHSPLSPTGFMLNGKNYACEELNPELVVVEVPHASVLRMLAHRIFKNNIIQLKDAYGKEKIALENVSPTALKQPILDIKKLRDFCYEHDVFVNFDISNCAASGMDVLLSCDMLIPRIKNVHFSDYGGHFGKGHLLPGMGLLPLGMLLSRLNEYRYNGLITVEVEQGYPEFGDEDPVILYSEIVGFIRSYFDQRQNTPPAAVSQA